jgi:hypothetical protein
VDGNGSFGVRVKFFRFRAIKRKPKIPFGVGFKHWLLAVRGRQWSPRQGFGFFNLVRQPIAEWRHQLSLLAHVASPRIGGTSNCIGRSDFLPAIASLLQYVVETCSDMDVNVNVYTNIFSHFICNLFVWKRTDTILDGPQGRCGSQ